MLFPAQHDRERARLLMGSIIFVAWRTSQQHLGRDIRQGPALLGAMTNERRPGCPAPHSPLLRPFLCTAFRDAAIDLSLSLWLLDFF